MKVLHVPYTYWPDAVGGTEVYVRHLIAGLTERGITSAVAVPAPEASSSLVDGTPVHRFAHDDRADVEYVYGRPNEATVAGFIDVLDAVQPDVLHQHALSPACSPELMTAAAGRGVAVVFTYHTPAVSCQRGTLLRWGHDVCDGVLDTAPCAPCVLHDSGIAEPLGALLGAVPVQVGRLLGRMGRTGGVWTAARMTALIETRTASIREAFRRPDRLVALTSWSERLLRANGVEPERLVTVRHGLPEHPRPPARPHRNTAQLRLACVGRLHPTKGFHVVISALSRLPDASVTLDIAGITQDSAADAYARSLRGQAGRDPRVRFLDTWPAERVVDELAAYDLVVVPSQWLETGPLVVLEAFAAGVPVLGSALGGIEELVTDGRNGLLVRPFDDADAWRATLERVLAGRPSAHILSTGVRPPRRLADVSREMEAVYLAALETRERRRPSRAPALRS